jgi:long-chain acyl-CoA synthetase
MDAWHGTSFPALRHEAPFPDRVVRAFAQRPTSVYAMLAQAVAQRPTHEALVNDGQRFTYAELETYAGRIAAGLAARSVAAGDRVACVISNRPEFVFVLFALQRLGAIAVPIGVREARAGLVFMLNQCGAKAVVFDADLADKVPGAADVPTLALRVSIGVSADAVSLDELAQPGLRAAPVAAVAEGETAVILYTSGTTGHPKGAKLTHYNLAHSVLHYEACMRLSGDDRSALAVPASHVTGLVAIILSMVHVGGTVVIVPAFKAGEFVRLLERERITHTLMVPAMYTLCLMEREFPGAGDDPGRDLASWRVGGYGGAPMPVATIDELGRRLPGLVLQNAYGATETTSPATMMPAGRTRDHADTVGVALPCADIRVMDDAGREVPRGETGELWIGGPMVVPGYWDNPAATQASFTAGHWHSGDLGSVDDAGFVRLFDRKKDMLNRGGFKVYSVEVENALMALPGVVEVAIVGRHCPVLGERVHAFIHAPDAPHDDAAVRAFCAARLADYKVPETITWSDTPLPRNANGKLVKRALRERLLAESPAAPAARDER